jgi:hypothetical protein
MIVPRRPTVGRRRLAAVTTGAAAALITLAGCGSSNGVPAVARVDGIAISRASLAHRIEVENARLQGASLRIPVPDPPSYLHCTVAAQAAQSHLKRHPGLSPQQLRQRCARVYAQLRDGALAFLITADWLQGEAAAQGITVSHSEVAASYHQLLAGPAGAAFANRLTHDHMTGADELLQLRIEMLSLRLRERIAGRHQPLDGFVASFRRRWRQRTTCQPGYVVAECRNGPSLPSAPAG